MLYTINISLVYNMAIETSKLYKQTRSFALVCLINFQVSRDIFSSSDPDTALEVFQFLVVDRETYMCST